MSTMYLLITISLLVGIAAWLLFIWAVKSGQYDDTEGPKYRMLEDDDDADPDAPKKKNSGQREERK
ncbi:MAG TPA: cbb3-type cytochrome oxidase assembly protein CcoS [Nitrospirota bacterium]|nr:cbb3-type cytochrome oxidase assembly protein CcoS [Nitrospirota bacterium]